MTFVEWLREAMRRESLSIPALAARLGVHEGVVESWLYQGRLPAVALTDALGDLVGPEVVQLVMAPRKARCAECRRRFYRAVKWQRFCTSRCMSTAAKRRERETRATRPARKLLAFSRAVEQMCRECEPTAICHNTDCPLRTVSPYPLGSTPKATTSGAIPRSPQPGGKGGNSVYLIRG